MRIPGIVFLVVGGFIVGFSYYITGTQDVELQKFMLFVWLGYAFIGYGLIKMVIGYLSKPKVAKQNFKHNQPKSSQQNQHVHHQNQQVHSSHNHQPHGGQHTHNVQHDHQSHQHTAQQSSGQNQFVKFCSNCGNAVRHFDNFCYKCGNRMFHQK